MGSNPMLRQLLVLTKKSALLGPGLELTFRGSFTDAANATVYTFSAVPGGIAYADRTVFVGVTGAGTASRSVSGVKINGVDATIGVERAHSSSEAAVASIWAAVVPDGADLEIEVTWNGGQQRCGIGVWTANGISSLTPVHTVNSQADPAVGTLTTVTGRPAFVVYYQRSDPSSVVWGAPLNPPDYAELFEATRYQGGAGVVAAGTSISVSVNPSTNDSHVMVGASYN